MSARTLLLTAIAMLAFAGNSLLCRLALKTTQIDPATFTSLRLLSGALMLALLLRLRHGSGAKRMAGSWSGAAALFIYAAAFSFAYVSLDAGVGALLLFGAVQICMLLFGWSQGERPRPMSLAGLLLAFTGLLVLLLPGTSAPSAGSALLMLIAGVAWGTYSLLGRTAGDALAATAGNFVRSVPVTTLLSLALLYSASWDLHGVLYALASGALASGLGYAIWYTAITELKAIQAATVQLSVPIITALAGALLLGEALSMRLTLSSLAVLGGIALVLMAKQRAKA
ncbi:DMT family transporter [Phytopseudomonas punonensis]|uniref:Threonine/homoserine efflux transporter RhtA n=1 Tax=Phytopseudomonas punonensis TaxID=1220495 RepID=A0A1M7P2E6_9GAMM|nr:DMT family transporter [Pseudomonas punonensis]SHN10701.1 Threonine/homoserine efflux transporter RhtA [Pseudomonas punonensis]